MYFFRFDLPAHPRKYEITLLQARLGDELDLDERMKQAHWSLKGLHFHQLYYQFDKIHGEVEDLVHTIVDRISDLLKLV